MTVDYNIKGYNSNLTKSWTKVGNINFLTSPSTVELISSNSNDTIAGTGARKVRIIGVDSNYLSITEIIDMNGTSASSPSTNQFIRVYDAYVYEVGTYNNSNDGDITIRVSGGGADILMIDANDGVSNSSLISTGLEDYLYVYNLNISTINSPQNIRLYQRRNYNNTSSNISSVELVNEKFRVETSNFDFNPPLRFDPYSDFWIEAISNGAKSTITCDVYYKLLPIAVNTDVNIQNIDSKIRNTAFGEIRVANRTNLIDLKSSFGLNDLRDIVGTTGSATVTNVINSTGEYTIATTANSTDEAVFQTRERGRYTAGIECECGIAFRLGDLNYSGNEFVRWGYFDEENGYYYQYDSNGLRCFVRKAGVDINVPITVDLDRIIGNNIVIDLNLLEGHIYNISVVWYGYGSINYYININNYPYIIATYNPVGGTSTLTANLPIGVQLKNNGTATAHNVYVAGRQFSFLGDYTPTFRLTPIIVLSKSVPSNNAGSTNGNTPIFAIRNKLTSTVAQLKFQSIEVLSDEDVLIQVFLDATLTGSSFGGIPNITSSNTLLEYDVSSTDFTSSGLLIYTTLVKGGTRQLGSALSTPQAPILYDLTGAQNITFTARSLGGTASIDVVVNFQEEF
jgi:hypothetical protein